MRRLVLLWISSAALLAVGFPGSARGQGDVFTLSIEAPAELGGSAGSTQSTTAYTRLKHEGNPPGNGAQGWSYGILQDAADANDDGVVDVSDAVYLFQHQFQPPTAPNPDPPPPAPFDECGTDPTDDAVGCRARQDC